MTDDAKSIVLISNDVNSVPGLGETLLAHRHYKYEVCQGTLSEINGQANALADQHDLILFRTHRADERDVEAIRSLREKNGSSTVILALSDDNTTLADAQKLARAGVDGVLAETITADELEQEIQRRLRPAPEAHHVHGSDTSMPTGKIITVMRSRGGVGATTVAVNLADHLLGTTGHWKKAATRRVALVDFDLQFGAIAGFVDAKPNEALYSLATMGGAPDATFVSQAMYTLPSGLAVLTSPAQILPMDAVRPEQIKALLSTLQGQYDYIVVDLPMALVDWLAPVVNTTDRMLLVTDTAVPSIHQTRRLIDFCTEENLGLPIDIVVNQEREPMIKRRHHIEAAKALERPLRYWLPPSPKAAREAIDRGEPLSKVAGSSSLNKSIKQLAKSIVTDLSKLQVSTKQTA